ATTAKQRPAAVEGAAGADDVVAPGGLVSDHDDEPCEPDTSVAHPARVWNYLLGGKDNFAADRAVAENVLEVMPVMGTVARAGRAFLATAVHHLAAEAGVRQFLDIGTGLPAASNTHEVAQCVAPESRVVYVDNDPIVLAHARALLPRDPRGGGRVHRSRSPGHRKDLPGGVRAAGLHRAGRRGAAGDSALHSRLRRPIRDHGEADGGHALRQFPGDIACLKRYPGRDGSGRGAGL